MLGLPARGNSALASLTLTEVGRKGLACEGAQSASTSANVWPTMEQDALDGEPDSLRRVSSSFARHVFERSQGEGKKRERGRSPQLKSCFPTPL